MSDYQDDWRVQAVALANTGTASWRDISKMLSIPRTTVSDYLRGYYGSLAEVNEPVVHNNINSRILWISDLHAPFQHKKAIQFLADLHAKYSFTRIVVGGDEADSQSLNMHGVNPDLPNTGEELEMTKAVLRELYELFPVADILESNHTSLAYRRAFKAGLSKGYMKNYNEVFDAPDTWIWHNDLLLTLPNGQRCYFCHGKSADGLKLSKNMTCNTVQGHYHSKFSIQYWSNPRELYWSMQAGCLIDDKSMAMNYNKLTMDRPIIGTGAIIDSQPILFPMEL